MTTDLIIEKIIAPCLKKASLGIPNVSEIKSFDGLILYGEESAVLDSLNLVGFIFLIEEQIQATFGVDIKFSAEDILNTDARPFLNIKNLSLFLLHKVSAAK
ncbi:MAG: hypothetical protein ABL930_01470 [Pseudobdellovibrio sp.]